MLPKICFLNTFFWHIYFCFLVFLRINSPKNHANSCMIMVYLRPIMQLLSYSLLKRINSLSNPSKRHPLEPERPALRAGRCWLGALFFAIYSAYFSRIAFGSGSYEASSTCGLQTSFKKVSKGSLGSFKIWPLI